MRKLHFFTLSLFLFFTLLSAHAQKDFDMITERSPWTLSGNAAALSTFADSTMSRAAVTYDYTAGGHRTMNQGKTEHKGDAMVESYMHLSPQVMAYGKARYTTKTGSEMTGSAFSGIGGGCMPFDIIDTTANAGRKNLELFNIVGAVSYAPGGGFSLGAKADFSAGSYAKHKDLRHKNTITALDTRLSVAYSLVTRHSSLVTRHSSLVTCTLGASFIYKRYVEGVQFKTYGTADQIYTSLIEYANMQGTAESSDGNGFTDSSYENPLLNEYVGFNVGGSLPVGKLGDVFAELEYLHRTGYYGKQGQYSVSYANHKGDQYNWHIRYTLPSWGEGTLSFLDFRMNSERLRTYRTNYRQSRSETDNSLTYYEYFTPTKIADKAINQGMIGYTMYWGNHQTLKHSIPQTLYTWCLKVGTGFYFDKETAYNATMMTVDYHIWSPYITVTRNIMFRDTSYLGLTLGANGQASNLDDELMERYAHQNLRSWMGGTVKAMYEFRLKSVKGVRPNVSLLYAWQDRSNVQLTIGAMF